MANRLPEPFPSPPWLRVHEHEAGMTMLAAAIAKAAAWLELEGVEGVAQGESRGEPCILVLASRPGAEVRKRVPATFEGFRVVVRSSLGASGAGR